MMQVRTTVLLLASAVAAGSTCSAQTGLPSVLALNGNYHFAEYSLYLPASPATPELWSGYGTLAFQSNATLTLNESTYEVFGPGSTLSSTDTGAGTWLVAPTGRLLVDMDPANPGTDTAELHIAPDGGVFALARADVDGSSLFVVALRESAGLTNAVLQGTYRFVGARLEYTGAGIEAVTEAGTATFDGAGNATVSGDERMQAANGSISLAPFASAGTYAVAANGLLTLAGSTGAVSADGDLLYIVHATGSEIGLSIAVRIGSSYDLTALAGDFGIVGADATMGLAADRPASAMAFLDWRLGAATPMAGSAAVSGSVVHTTPLGQAAGPLPGLAGAVSLLGSGAVQVGPAALQMTLSATGAHAVGRVPIDTANATGMVFALRVCPCGAYGTGTQGTAAIEPKLGMRQFPELGNAAFELVTADALGGSAGFLVLSLAQLPGIPAFGGQLWIDPTQAVVSTFLLFGGAAGVPGAGSATLSLPIPAQTVFAGLDLYGQVLAADAGAASGFALTKGLHLRICR